MNIVKVFRCAGMALCMGDMLDHIAAKCNIDDLMSAADAENGAIKLEKAADERDLVAVFLIIDTDTGCVFLTVQNGINICTAGYKKRIAAFCICKVHGKHRFNTAGSKCIYVVLKTAGFTAQENFDHDIHPPKRKNICKFSE